MQNFQQLHTNLSRVFHSNHKLVFEVDRESNLLKLEGTLVYFKL